MPDDPREKADLRAARDPRLCAECAPRVRIRTTRWPNANEAIGSTSRDSAETASREA
jgi:hypothetical protein